MDAVAVHRPDRVALDDDVVELGGPGVAEDLEEDSRAGVVVLLRLVAVDVVDVESADAVVRAGPRVGTGDVHTAPGRGGVALVGDVEVAYLPVLTLPSFAAQGALQDVAEYASPAKDDFQEAAWTSVTLGDQVYGAPVDTGPMVMFYNKEVFDSLDLAPPPRPGRSTRRRPGRSTPPALAGSSRRPTWTTTTRASPGRRTPAGSA
ncbi:extracellular solute-binding protein [Streptomyces althioticus]|uniref:extracellular solute-binding protein n=1 Tax=Streptomyces althioticus TaxID=83380 RepID=UPI0036CB5E43